MFLTITTTHQPATDLGYLLHKHPGRVQSFRESMGTAYVFYPESTDERCTAALLLEVDPIGLVRGRQGTSGDAFALGQYVNDRPYAASSMLALALKDVFRTALTGRCTARPELATTAIPLRIELLALPCRGGTPLLRRFFEPLGWVVEAASQPLDPTVPTWGDSRYWNVSLTGTVRLADALNHLYVLLPVLDDAKHYWVGIDEVDKLVRAGTGWLADHPDLELITRRYLAHRTHLTRSALARLAEVDDLSEDQLDDAVPADAPLEPERATVGQTQPEAGATLADLRRAAVIDAIRSCGATRVGDLGCGEGVLVGDLLADRSIERVVAMDVSARALQIAGRRLHLDTMPERQRARLDIFQSALTYRDARLAGLDAAVLMEVIEHVDPPRLPALAAAVFGHARPGAVIVTTPNVEHNVRYPALPAGARRHHDHRFEWTRAEFRTWAAQVAELYGYAVEFRPVGADDPEVGPPTQLAIFTRPAAERGAA